MSTIPQTALQQAPEAALSPAPWSRVKRIAFRFFSLYFVLFALSCQVGPALLPIPRVEIASLGQWKPVMALVAWTAAHVFSIHKALVYRSGSGDKTFDWVLTFCVLMLAICGTVVWSVLDRHRLQYARLYPWVTLFLRFCLAGQMIIYGLVKVVPLQMPFPSLTRLLERYGNFSPMGVLWASVGASRPYEIFVGSAELSAGLLLIFPRTSTPGLLLCLVDLIEVFALNMTYDVPVKLFSLQLIVLTCFLLAPQARRLADFLVFNRPVEPSRPVPLFSGARANRIAVWAQCIFGLLLVLGHSNGLRESWSKFGGGHPKSSFYGIWNVQAMTYDGKPRPLSLAPTDAKLWRRLVFDLPDYVTAECMDESLASFRAAIDPKNKTVALTLQNKPKWRATLTSARSAPDKMTLEGLVDGHQLHLDLQAMDLNKFLLLGNRFHWIQEYPVNR